MNIKLIRRAIVLSVAIFSLTISNAIAQQGAITIGPGLAFADDLGISLDGYYGINENIRAGAKFTYFFAEDAPGIDVDFYTFDINGHYSFFNQDQISAYGIAGLNIAFINVDVDGFGSTSDNETGLNLGAGGEYALDFGTIFAELTLAGIGGDADDFVIGAGVRFGL